jgi:hypothetical protein
MNSYLAKACLGNEAADANSGTGSGSSRCVVPYSEMLEGERRVKAYRQFRQDREPAGPAMPASLPNSH